MIQPRRLPTALQGRDGEGPGVEPVRQSHRGRLQAGARSSDSRNDEGGTVGGADQLGYGAYAAWRKVLGIRDEDGAGVRVSKRLMEGLEPLPLAVNLREPGG
jgi:hypothetical protein